MDISKYEFQSEFARRYEAEGRRRVVLKQLATRFGTLSRGVEVCIRDANSEELDGIVKRVLTARTLQEALGPLPSDDCPLEPTAQRGLDPAHCSASNGKTVTPSSDESKYGYESEFASLHFGHGFMEGWFQGRAEGRIEIVLRQLALRYGPLSPGMQARIRGVTRGELDGIADRLLTASTLDEAVGIAGHLAALCSPSPFVRSRDPGRLP